VSLAAVLLGLFNVMVSFETDPDAMVDGLKDFARVGDTMAAALTVKLALAGNVLLPLLVCKAPAAIELR
jgi:hypothetical protein